MAVSVCARAAGLVSAHALLKHDAGTDAGATPVPLTATARLPYVAADAPALDFGAVPPGQRATARLVLRNPSPVAARVAVAASPRGGQLAVAPAEGLVPPGGSLVRYTRCP